MENANELPKGNISVDKLFHLPGVNDIESELFDAILTASPSFSFNDLSENSLTAKYTHEQIFNAFKSLENKKFLSYNDKFNIIELHLQSILK